jgi:hypothetical protein
MIKELPNQVFSKEYDNFYLFTEFDIIFNEIFYEKLNLFMSEIDCNKLLIRIDEMSLNNLPTFNKSFKFECPDKNTLKGFYERELVIDDRNVPIYCLNHFIYDEKGGWEIYVSLENEMSILGCSNNLKSVFVNLFEPYKEESLQTKLKIIGDRFSDKKIRDDFFCDLGRNYKFSE